MVSGVAAAQAERIRPRSVSYRYDLDGLRGIAIAFVVFFHIFVGRVSGGVDVFLLLSGYFFLGSQLRYARRADASANPWWPIWRTIRRLVPTLVVVLAGTVAALVVVAPELRTTTLGRQLWASLGYYQNWELATQDAAYDSASLYVSPLQHLWSMAVQGQFYLMAIGLAMLVIWVRRTGLDISKLVGPLLVVVTVASFIYAWMLHGVDQQLNYYSTWSRLWQLTLGALLALYGSHLTLPNRLRVAATWIGLAMVLTTGFIFDGASAFPGPAALYPIGGAVLIIAGGGYGRLAQALAHRWMRWLGDIAYALYLWHWPLLILALAYVGEDDSSIWIGVGVVAVSVLLADLTHRFVEVPLRQHGKRPVQGEKRVAGAMEQVQTEFSARGRSIGAVLIVALTAMLMTVPQAWAERIDDIGQMRLDPRQYPGAMATAGQPVPPVEEYQPELPVVHEYYPPAWTRGCMSVFGDDPALLPVEERGEDDCVLGDPDARFDVYVVGGSHAEQWTTALDMLGWQYRFRVIPLTRQSCPTFETELDGVFSEECQIFNQSVLRKIDEDRPDLVMSTSTRPLIEQGRSLDEVPLSYPTLWNFLAERDIPFVGLRDNPWFLEPDGSGFMVSRCVAETGDVDGCGQPRSQAYAPVDPAARYLRRLPNMKAVDTSEWFCPGDTCPGVIGNVYVYRDGNHFSVAYGESLAPLLWDEIKEFF